MSARPAAAAALLALLLAGCTGRDVSPGPSPGPPPGASPGSTTGTPDATRTPPATVAQAPPPGPATVRCPAPTRTVSTAAELTAALAAASPGDSIRLADGTYGGRFVATRSGTDRAPVFLCGGKGAVLDGGGVGAGYGLHLNGAGWWRLVGFTVRNAQKGVMADRARHCVIQGLTVTGIGDEAIHLRSFSSDNLVVGNTVSRTGLRREKFGEGVYVGSATSNWRQYSGGGPDRSDRNVVRGNSIAGTTAEAVDIKEGTTAGVLLDNVFDGSALTEEGADSWVDVKGNGWLIQGNVGRNSPQDGYQTHDVEDGWGTGNVFRANLAVNVRRYGIALTPELANRVACDNKVVGGGQVSRTGCG
jgi:hypothetical protein